MARGPRPGAAMAETTGRGGQCGTVSRGLDRQGSAGRAQRAVLASVSPTRLLFSSTEQREAHSSGARKMKRPLV